MPDEFKDLKPGTYTISISQPGFKPFTKSLSLNAGEAIVVDIRVELQTVTEKVEVSEETQSIATEDVTAPSLELAQRQLISLPTAQEKIREVLSSDPWGGENAGRKAELQRCGREPKLIARKFRAHHRSGDRQFRGACANGCRTVVRGLQDALQRGPGKLFRRIDRG